MVRHVTAPVLYRIHILYISVICDADKLDDRGCKGSTGLDSVKAGIYEDLWIDFSAMKMNGSY